MDWKPLLFLTEDNDAQERVFFNEVLEAFNAFELWPDYINRSAMRALCRQPSAIVVKVRLFSLAHAF